MIVLRHLLFLLLLHHINCWVWTCDSGTYCLRKRNDFGQPSFPTIESCRMLCGINGSLWPVPTGQVKLGQTFDLINLRTVKFILNGNGEAKSYLKKMSQYFYDLIDLHPINCNVEGKDLRVVLNSNSDDVKLQWKTDESYKLAIDNTDTLVEVTISGQTIFGIRHGLETLSQLITSFPTTNTTCLVIVSNAQITDKPVYAHRGLLVDTARNYQSISTLKKHIDGLAASKMNVLHWHITDSQSFPMVSLRVPNMSKFGAYSKEEIYTPEDIKDLMEYAKIRGVRIILELDGPGHIGSGWQWGPDSGLGNLGVCLFKQPWRSYCIQPPCGQLNPVNPNVYKVLQNLYNDMIDLNPDMDLFHMGGDEVFIPCWNSTKEITSTLNGTTEKDFLDLWSLFQRKALNAFDAAKSDANTWIILWTSHLTDIKVVENYLPKKRYIIQTWVPQSDSLPEQLLEKGYKLIISTKNKWYLDHGFWGTTTYYKWVDVYNNNILTHPNVLGGEVCMWGELVDDSNVMTRTWPRTAAAAERLWSNPGHKASEVKERFYVHRDRLIFRGINSEALVPKWCSQNEKGCDDYLTNE